MIYDFFYYMKYKIKENFHYYYNNLKSKYNVFYFTYIYDTNFNKMLALAHVQ